MQLSRSFNSKNQIQYLIINKKNQMKKNRIIMSVCALLLIFGGCKSKSLQPEEVKQEPVDTSSIVNTGEYFMETIFEQGISAGKETVIKLTPRISSDPKATVELQTLHDKKMHVIIVKNDLSLFYHIHPSQSGTQEYTVPFTFNFGGDYVVFVDYAPEGAVQQLERKEINVTGKDYAPKGWSMQNGTVLHSPSPRCWQKNLLKIPWQQRIQKRSVSSATKLVSII